MIRSPSVERLSEGQRACLRLVLAGYEAKEIARELNISLIAVNERLRAAREVLGVSRSRDAARILAEYEGAADPKRLVAKPSVVAEVPSTAPFNAPPDQQAVGEGTGRPVEVRDVQAAFAPFDAETRQALPAPPTSLGKVRNGLIKAERLRQIIQVGSGIVTLACMVLLLSLLLTILLKPN